MEDGETSQQLCFSDISLERIRRLPLPIGLNLGNTDSLLKEINDTLFPRKKEKKSPTLYTSKRFSGYYYATLLSIGAYSFETRHGLDNLVIKFYLVKPNLVWEISDRSKNNQNYKVEIPFCNILAIRVVIEENRPDILEIELEKQPTFYHEMIPYTRSHPEWELSEDFTGGHASTYRRHYLEFPPGTLGKNYKKLLKMDRRLLELSQRPFPSLESPYFNNSWANMENYSPLVHDLGGSETNPTSQYRQPAEPVILPQLQAEQLGNTCTKGAPPPSSSTSPIPSDINYSSGHLNGFNDIPMPQVPEQALIWSQGLDGSCYTNMFTMSVPGGGEEVQLQQLSFGGLENNNGIFVDTTTWPTQQYHHGIISESDTQMANAEQLYSSGGFDNNGIFCDTTWPLTTQYCGSDQAVQMGMPNTEQASYGLDNGDFCYSTTWSTTECGGSEMSFPMGNLEQVPYGLAHNGNITGPNDVANGEVVRVSHGMMDNGNFGDFLLPRTTRQSDPWAWDINSIVMANMKEVNTPMSLEAGNTYNNGNITNTGIGYNQLSTHGWHA